MQVAFPVTGLVRDPGLGNQELTALIQLINPVSTFQ
jgi:hypothetical protein